MILNGQFKVKQVKIHPLVGGIWSPIRFMKIMFSGLAMSAKIPLFE